MSSQKSTKWQKGKSATGAYYRGLKEWGNINGHLTDTCLSAQDAYKASLDYFKIKY